MCSFLQSNFDGALGMALVSNIGDSYPFSRILNQMTERAREQERQTHTHTKTNRSC